MVKPYLYIDVEEDPWEDDTNDTPGRGMSGWLTGADGAFRIPYRNDFKFGTGDYTVIQTFNATASGGTRVATYDDYTANAGLRFSQTSNTFSVESGDVTVNLPTNILDGTNRIFMAERESGVAVNAYVDDFTVVTASGGDGGTDINNTEDLDLAYDGTTYMDGMLGVTVVFDRLLEDFEKDDMYFWIESNYEIGAEPDWLRSEAVLYINPNDDVQRAEYGVRENILNLALDVPDEIYVRYEFVSDDGIDNPELQFTDIKFSNLEYYRQSSEIAYDGGPSPRLKLGHGQQPYVALTGSSLYDSVTLSIDELGTTWLNDNWTVNFWTKVQEDGVAQNILVQDGTGVMAIRDRADNTISLYFNGVAVLVSSSPSPAHKQYSMVTVRRNGSNFEMFINAISENTGSTADTVTPTTDLKYNPAQDALIGPLHIWKRALTDEEIQALYKSAPQGTNTFGGDTVTITDSFSTDSLNWELR